MEAFKQRFLVPLVILFVLNWFGTAGYMVIEGWSFVDSLYMTVITLTTVGFREVHPLSLSGRVFTIVLATFGAGTALYLVAVFASFVLHGELRDFFGRRKMEKAISSLSGHYIVCGLGRMGKVAVSELKPTEEKFVVVEKDPEVVPPDTDLLYYIGDATDDAVLKAVGIERASKLISVLGTDADNLFVVLSARRLNPDLFIVARCEREGSESKMLAAGADKVVSAYRLGGMMIAHSALKPNVVDFLSLATSSSHLDLQIEEVKVAAGSELAGKTLGECDISCRMGIILVAVIRPDGTMKFNPDMETVVSAGDTLIVMGEVERLRVFQQAAQGRG